MRVLLGCELGQNLGHITSLSSVAQQLLRASHTVGLAAPVRFHWSMKAYFSNAVFKYYAPDWGSSAGPPPVRQSLPGFSMTDVLCEAGLDRPGTVSSAILQWINILNDFRPDVIVAEYAPGLLMAARGRVPRISVGTGFTCPPANGLSFPALSGVDCPDRDKRVLSVVSSELRIASITPPQSLPEAFSAEAELIATFKELDPYAQFREINNYIYPGVPFALPTLSNSRNPGVFVYSYNFINPKSMFWKALAALGMKTTVYMNRPSTDHIDVFKALDFKLLTEPLSFSGISKICSVVVSHGGHGTTCSAILSGIPTVAAYFDFEKSINAINAERLGVCVALNINGLKPVILIEKVFEQATSRISARVSRKVANNFRLRYQNGFLESVIEAINTFL